MEAYLSACLGIVRPAERGSGAGALGHLVLSRVDERAAERSSCKEPKELHEEASAVVDVYNLVATLREQFVFC